jgi:hypothetical protein
LKCSAILKGNKRKRRRKRRRRRRRWSAHTATVLVHRQLSNVSGIIIIKYSNRIEEEHIM